MCLGTHILMVGSAPQRTKAYHTVPWRTVPYQASVVPRSDAQRLHRPGVHSIYLTYGTDKPASPIFSEIEGAADLQHQAIEQGFMQQLCQTFFSRGEEIAQPSTVKAVAANRFTTADCNVKVAPSSCNFCCVDEKYNCNFASKTWP